MANYYYASLLDTTGKTLVEQQVKPRYHAYSLFIEVTDDGEFKPLALDYEGDVQIQMQRDLSVNRALIIPISEDVYERAVELNRRFKSVAIGPNFPLYMSGNLEPDTQQEKRGARPVDIFGNVSDSFSEEELEEFEWTGNHRARTNCVTFSRFVQETAGISLDKIAPEFANVTRAKRMHEIMAGLLTNCFNQKAEGKGQVAPGFCLQAMDNGEEFLMGDNTSDEAHPFSEWIVDLEMAIHGIDKNSKFKSDSSSSAFTAVPKPYPQIILNNFNARRRRTGLPEFAA